MKLIDLRYITIIMHTATPCTPVRFRPEPPHFFLYFLDKSRKFLSSMDKQSALGGTTVAPSSMSRRIDCILLFNAIMGLKTVDRVAELDAPEVWVVSSSY
jgi:hypothetical protein